MQADCGRLRANNGCTGLRIKRFMQVQAVIGGGVDRVAQG